ncbi:uncharacterized protein TNCV_3456311 [Trichonephila clavipes]|nr:uncharacterized protein TNCV_3456311 [Trichonephila clavipes]
MSRQHVAKWCRSFQSGRQDVEIHNMAGSDQPSSSTEINITRVKEIIQNDLRVILHEISGTGLEPVTKQATVRYLYHSATAATFPRLKEPLSGRRFSSDSAVKTSAETWLNEQGPDFYQDGLSKLVLRSDKCLIRLGDYVEK